MFERQVHRGPSVSAGDDQSRPRQSLFDFRQLGALDRENPAPCADRADGEALETFSGRSSQKGRMRREPRRGDFSCRPAVVAPARALLLGEMWVHGGVYHPERLLPFRTCGPRSRAWSTPSASRRDRLYGATLAASTAMNTTCACAPCRRSPGRAGPPDSVVSRESRTRIVLIGDRPLASSGDRPSGRPGPRRLEPNARGTEGFSDGRGSSPATSRSGGRAPCRPGRTLDPRGLFASCQTE